LKPSSGIASDIEKPPPSVFIAALCCYGAGMTGYCIVGQRETYRDAFIAGGMIIGMITASHLDRREMLLLSFLPGVLIISLALSTIFHSMFIGSYKSKDFWGCIHQEKPDHGNQV
jgi:hypothetical protein